jgi:hypothetical protein
LIRFKELWSFASLFFDFSTNRSRGDPLSTFRGSANADMINGPAVAGPNDRIDGLDGDDTITLAPEQTFVSGPGNDIVTGEGGTSQYGLWFARSLPLVDLQQGYANDGFGGRDTLSGISTVHMSSLGGTVIGSSRNEIVFAFSGQKMIDLGGGTDTVIYYQQKSSSYDVTSTGAEYRLRNVATGMTDIVRNVEYIEFEDKTIITGYDQAALKATFQYPAYSFRESGMAPGYVYAGVYTPPSLVSWFVQAPFAIDLDGDGKLDIVAPMNRGYATGLDTRVPFIALTGGSGTLKFDTVINSQMPLTAGARRQDKIKLKGSDHVSVITVAHDTGDGNLADLEVVTSNLAEVPLLSLMPKLPAARVGRDYAVNAHSMAVGDLNGDGVDDVVVGDLSSPNGIYALLQQPDGKFVISYQDAFKTILSNWPMLNPSAGEGRNVLLDLHLVDVNGDGYDDLIAGWGHGSTRSFVFVNDKGNFSTDNKIALPESIYEMDNQMHLHTFHFDFNNDGSMDLAILWSRFAPYYGGNYIQLLQNDGKGHFTDVTQSRIDKPVQDAMGSRLEWTDFWQLIDVNGDGAVDIVGHRTGSRSGPVAYINDGTGRFSVTDIPTDLDIGRVIYWADLDQDGIVELVGFQSKWTDATGTSSNNQFNVFKLSGSALTPSTTSTHKIGTELDDVLVGTASNDILIGKGGDDTINGAHGVDTAEYLGLRFSYDLQITKDRVKISALKGSEGMDTLFDVERLKFSDLSLAFDTSGVAGQAYRIYKAAFDRTPDGGGLGYWITQMDKGMNTVDVAARFIDSPEFRSLYGQNATNADFLTKVYSNVLARSPDAGGLAWWVNEMKTNPTKTWQKVLADFSESTENQVNVASLIANGIEYSPWIG